MTQFSKVGGLSALVLTMFLAPTDASAKPPGGWTNLCFKICGKYYPVVMPAPAAGPLIKAKIAIAAGTYYLDKDGDGYGSSSKPTKICPAAGYVTTGGDCDDAQAATNPGAAEVCGDSADNNCNGTADEGCSSCPCFTTAQIDTAYAAWQSQSYDDSGLYCEEHYITSATPEHYVYLNFYGTATAGTVSSHRANQFFSNDTDPSTGALVCSRYVANYDYDAATDKWTFYQSDVHSQSIDAAAFEQCSALLRTWSSAHSVSCPVYNN